MPRGGDPYGLYSPYDPMGGSTFRSDPGFLNWLASTIGTGFLNPALSDPSMQYTPDLSQQLGGLLGLNLPNSLYAPPDRIYGQSLSPGMMPGMSDPGIFSNPWSFTPTYMPQANVQWPLPYSPPPVTSM